MTDTPPVPLLIVDDDRDLVRLLEHDAMSRGYRCASAHSLPQAVSLLDAATFEVALVDLTLGSDSGHDVMRQVKAQTPDMEIIVVSGTTSLASAIRSYELSAFAFVQKPFSLDQLFATVERAIERRRMNVSNRRLMWELQTINEVSDGIRQSLELQDILTGALQRVVRAFDATGGSIRVRDEVTGRYELHARVGPSLLHRMWDTFGLQTPRPSDQVIATRAAVVVEDLAQLVSPELAADALIRSALSVPMTVADELLGTLTIGAGVPFRFKVADQQLLARIAGQIAVAVQNARLHDSIRRGKREWEQTFDAIGDAIAVFDSRGLLLRGNTALAAHLGRTVTTLRTVGCRDVGFCGGTCPQCAVGRAVGGEDGRSEITLGDEQIFSVTTCPVGGGPDGAAVVQVAKNVTEEMRSARRLRQMSEDLSLANTRLLAAVDRLKSTQAQLLQAEKLSAIGQLVAGVAHELNNPLTSVIGYAQLLEEEFIDGGRRTDVRSAPELAKDMRRIAEESERAARIVRNLLAFARRQTAERVPQDVADLFSRVLVLRAYELRLNSIELRTDFAAGLPRVVADGGQLQQALLNLILNAERAMRGCAPRQLSVGARYDESAAAVELFVSDTGHGIEDANVSRIFDPFFTTRDVGEGTGLGLSICYGIVRDHGGQIAVRSQVHVGTTFSLLLPACLEDPPTLDPVLVAHSDQGERDYIAAVLAGWGHTVIALAGAEEAVARYGRGGLHAAFIDRRLMAADLPAWRAARSGDTARAPLILMASAGEEGDVEQFGREAAGAVLAPPFQLRSVRSAIRAVSKECV
jgi:two-component system NtrC family sensor kinase